MDVKAIASGSSGNCYRVSDGSTTILLDAGIPIRAIMQGCGFKLSDIAACFVTHYHSDHSKAARDLIRYGVPVYMTGKEITMLKSTSAKWQGYFIHTLPEIGGDEYYTKYIGSLLIRPFKVEHDTPEPVGFFISSRKTGERLVYFTDTYYVHYKFSGINYIIGEVNYDNDSLWEHIDDRETGAYRAKRLFTSHMSLDAFLDFLRANDLSKLRKIWLCHMSDDHSNAERIKAAVQRECGVEVEVC